MLEGSHGMARDADAAVALLEEKVKDWDAKAMWMLGVCCEFGIGTEQDVDRAEQLYERGAEQGSGTAMLLLSDKLKNKNGRGHTEMDLAGGHEKQQTNKQIEVLCVKFLWSTDQGCNSGCAKALASMLLMHVPLTTLNLNSLFNKAVNVLKKTKHTQKSNEHREQDW